MARILPFPAEARRGFQRVQSAYTLRQISRQFGIPIKYIQRWLEDGLLVAVKGAGDGELVFDIRSLARFRNIRERKAGGASIKEIDAELRGQLTLFGPPTGELLRLPERQSTFEYALMLFDRGAPEAEERFESALAQGDHPADCHCNLGILLFERGDVTGALDEFTLALAADPRHVESHFDLANLYFETGDLKLARLHYEAALHIEPEFADAWFNLGLLLAQMGDLSAASTALRKYSVLAEDTTVLELVSRIEEAAQAEGAE